MILVVNKRSYHGVGEYIARPSPLGNPYSHLASKWAEHKVKSREEAVEKYREWFDSQPEDSPAKQEFRRLVEKYKKDGELTLICWCSPADCHGYVLAEKIHEVVGDLK